MEVLNSGLSMWFPSFPITTLPFFRFTRLWSWQDPWKVLSLAVHGSFATCFGSPVMRDSNQFPQFHSSSLADDLSECLGESCQSGRLPGVTQSLNTHCENPKMIKNSKKRPTDWLTKPFPRLPVWWHEWLSSLAFNPMFVSGVKIAHSLKWSQPSRPGVRRTFYFWSSHR